MTRADSQVARAERRRPRERATLRELDRTHGYRHDHYSYRDVYAALHVGGDVAGPTGRDRDG